jgi:2-amino-4-hydroxy-6-hydroxymethyldihydropteridine diphosphokinase
MAGKSKIRNPKSEMVFIALGSNLGDSQQILRTAIEWLQQFSDRTLLKSSLWQTAPVDCPPGSPRFVNAVVGLMPRQGETPESLLTKLQTLEKEFGRRPKKVLNEPRTLDLDLIAFGNESRATKGLTLPHPRAHLRRFVLQPLSEIAPDLVLLGQSKTAAQLLREMSFGDTLFKMQ